MEGSSPIGGGPSVFLVALPRGARSALSGADALRFAQGRNCAFLSFGSTRHRRGRPRPYALGEGAALRRAGPAGRCRLCRSRQLGDRYRSGRALRLRPIVRHRLLRAGGGTVAMAVNAARHRCRTRSRAAGAGSLFAGGLPLPVVAGRNRDHRHRRGRSAGERAGLQPAARRALVAGRVADRARHAHRARPEGHRLPAGRGDHCRPGCHHRRLLHRPAHSRAAERERDSAWPDAATRAAQPTARALSRGRHPWRDRDAAQSLSPQLDRADARDRGAGRQAGRAPLCHGRHRRRAHDRGLPESSRS